MAWSFVLTPKTAITTIVIQQKNSVGSTSGAVKYDEKYFAQILIEEKNLLNVVYKNNWFLFHATVH